MTSDLKNMEAEISFLNSKIEKARLEQNEFIELAAHDLNAPLRKLVSFTDLLISKIPGSIDPQLDLYKNKIHGCIRQMQELLNRFTLLAGVSASGPYVRCNLGDIVKEANRQIENDSACKISLTISDLPEIYCIRSQLVTVFKELLMNAARYSKKGAIPEVTITSDQPDAGSEAPSETHFTYHKVMVSDKGIGIEPEAFEKIFLPLKTIHGKAENGGHGLGLTICRKIIEHHHGTIYAKSDINQTTIIMILPENPTIC